MDPYGKTATLAFRYLNRVSATGPYMVEDGLASEAGLPDALAELDVAVRHDRHGPSPGLVCESGLCSSAHAPRDDVFR